ncbi:MAG: acetate/propionate family kinase [Burkholderiales bacterium]
MTGAILVINAGSSSIKFSLLEAVETLPSRAWLRGQVDGLGGGSPRFVAFGRDGGKLADESVAVARASTGHDSALAHLFGWLERSAPVPIIAVGHRVVHGGSRFSDPVRIDAEVLAALRTLIPLAPLHQPHNLAAIESIIATRPDLPQIACFDTAFHRTQSPLAEAYALPRSLSAEGIKRYGFHGLSYACIAGVLPDYLGEAAAGRVIVAHLGNGASLCAMRDRKSVATTMGFTALDGLMMGTRSGSIDPGVLLYLLEQKGYDPAALASLLYFRSGLLGVSGLSHDMRVLLASDDPHAAEAIDLFVYRVGRELGSLAAALGGLDALVFTAGIGENAPAIRAKVCEGAAWLGIGLDPDANAAGGPRISRAGSRVSAWVIPTDEERVIAALTIRLLRP